MEKFLNSKLNKIVLYQYGFTLAEVLITLGIIGIVAALTIPNLIANYQQKEAVGRLKKAYSIISNAIKMSEVDHGEVLNWAPVPEKSPENSDAFVKKYFLPYLNVSKYCGYISNSHSQNDCYRSVDEAVASSKATVYAYYMYNTYAAPVAFYLSDGTLIKIGAVDGNWANILAFIYINIKPNDKSMLKHFSRNAFVTVLFKDGKYAFFKLNPSTGVPVPDLNDPLRPHLDFYARVKEDCKAGVYNSCGAMIQMNNWTVPKEYPW